jgi:hypothetical protein
MASIMKASSNLMAEDHASRIVTAQNLLFDLVESEAGANAFTHGPRRPGHSFFDGIHIKTNINTVNLTIGGPYGLTLDFEATRPAEYPIPEEYCTVTAGVYLNKHKKSAEKIEDYVFVPIVKDQGSVTWQDRDGTSYTPQQLCDFAFRCLREHTEQSLRT